MAYIITKSDGVSNFSIQDNTVNTDFSIPLVGQNYIGYGDEVATAFFHQLENFAHNVPPSGATLGQLWYNTATESLQVYNGSAFIPIGGDASVSTTEPTGDAGSLWYNPDTDLLYINDGTEWTSGGVKYSGLGIPGHQPADVTVNIETSNTAVGWNALGNPAIADTWACVAIGAESLVNTVANDNTVAVGFRAGRNLVGGFPAWGNPGLTFRRNKNTVIGSQAAEEMTDSYLNVAIGYKSMEQANPENFDHSGSVAIGAFSMANSQGKDNVGIGAQALSASVSGNDNTAIGTRAGSNLVSADDVIAIGHFAGLSNSLSDNIIIGNSADSSINGSDQIVIGHGLDGTADGRVHIGNASGHIYANFLTSGSWISTSDERFKTNIQDDNLGLDFINSLRPVTYTWKEREDYQIDTKTVMHGLIAQDVKKSLDDAGCDTFGGHIVNSDKDKTQGVSREMFVLPLINAVKELSKENENLRRRLSSQEVKMNKMMDMINELEKKINE
jgi:hypothetical protein